MGKTYSLSVAPRTAQKHKAKALRAEGKVPGTIYGKGMESISFEVNVDSFLKTLKEAGETHVIDLDIAGTKLPVLIHNVQINPVTQRPLNVEMYKVNLQEKLKTQIPVHVEGEAPAVKDGKGNLLILVNEVEIEALPTDIPEAFVVDASTLAEVNDEVKVKDIPLSSKVTLVTDPELVLVRIGHLVVEEVAPTPQAAPAEGEVAATPEEGEPAAPEAKAEETK